MIYQVNQKALGRSNKYYIERLDTAFRVFHVIKDQNNALVLKGGSLFSLGKEHLGIMGYLAGISAPIVVIIVLFFLRTALLRNIIPILFLFGILWAVGYTIICCLLFNRFRFTYTFRNGDGDLFGRLECNSMMSNWKICDPDGFIHAILSYSESEDNEFFRLYTPNGQYTAFYRNKRCLAEGKRLLDGQRFKEIDVRDSNGNLALSLLNYGLAITSEGVLSPLVTLLTGMCVASRLHQIWLYQLISTTTDKPTRTVANIH
ncbi:MAG: hypothetical protein ACFFE8_03530 [Candidatus Heimdallarchaeota archaeon]